MSATREQMEKMEQIFRKTPVTKVQEILGSGFLSDLCAGNISRADRDSFRNVLDLTPLRPPKTAKSTKCNSELFKIIEEHEIVVNLDCTPYIPEVWGQNFRITVNQHHRNGWVRVKLNQHDCLYVADRKVTLAPISGRNFLREMFKQKIESVHPNIMEALIECTNLIPEHWKFKGPARQSIAISENDDESYANCNVRRICFPAVTFSNDRVKLIRLMFFQDALKWVGGADDVRGLWEEYNGFIAVFRDTLK